MRARAREDEQWERGSSGNWQRARENPRTHSPYGPTVLFTRATGCSCLAAAARGSCSYTSTASSYLLEGLVPWALSRPVVDARSDLIRSKSLW